MPKKLNTKKQAPQTVAVTDEDAYKAKMLKDRERIIDRMLSYSTTLRMAAKALESENDQIALLNHMTLIDPGKRIKAFQKALRDKVLSYPGGMPGWMKK